MGNPAGDELRVHYGTVGQLADDINKGQRTVQAQLDALWDAVKRVDDAWEGEARQMFNAAKAQWDARANSIRTTLQTIETKVRQGSDDYQATDRKAASYFENF
ncbi:WXG100 family type VII secretion target [Streptomyces sp. JJ36]|uniref:WXG100 family type VII secretion target n=1 Tax=Streptomyces sp. JJ36 TaxID=2736645 RepID=UPI001F19155E|nr:WXG100 family type VII secretion target [Streptomyces sp. JJ36]MCF6524908.1 WXG100 family type VII secretion target [Streptomyces sp. JJ36]